MAWSCKCTMMALAADDAVDLGVHVGRFDVAAFDVAVVADVAVADDDAFVHVRSSL